jgi:hypothetical protein
MQRLHFGLFSSHYERVGLANVLVSYNVQRQVYFDFAKLTIPTTFARFPLPFLSTSGQSFRWWHWPEISITDNDWNSKNKMLLPELTLI